MVYEVAVIAVFTVALGIFSYCIYQMSWYMADIIYEYIRPIVERY